MLGNDRVAALGDDTIVVDAQARELAKDGGAVTEGRSDPVESAAVHDDLDVRVEHLAQRVEVAVVETLVVAGDKRSEVHGVLTGQRRPIETIAVYPTTQGAAGSLARSSHQNAIMALVVHSSRRPI